MLEMYFIDYKLHNYEIIISIIIFKCINMMACTQHFNVDMLLKVKQHCCFFKSRILKYTVFFWYVSKKCLKSRLIGHLNNLFYGPDYPTHIKSIQHHSGEIIKTFLGKCKRLINILLIWNN